jgi:uncharacterized protein YdeI (YjbR/CyaY-like superfamily)
MVDWEPPATVRSRQPEDSVASRDPRVDAYIEGAAEFAQPILRHLREVIHSASPEIGEDIKWGAPYFMHHGMLCGMAAFKGHCALGFWKEKLLFDEDERSQEAMGQFGRITTVSDLPEPEVLVGYVRKAMRLNENGVKVPRPARRRKDEPVVPEAFRKALEATPKAAAAFQAFSPSHRREYVEWIAEAKRDRTRERRIATAIEWIAEGKPRNWKYMKR